jgi:hypothetical protein
MANNDRTRVIYHGAVVMLVGLLCGLPTVSEEEPARLWHTAHESLILIGILLLAMSSVLQFLVLPKRESTALVWALLATGYGLMVGLVIQGITGAHAFSPTTNPVLMFAFIANATGMLGSVLTASLTIMGARAASRAAVASIQSSS